MAKFNDLNKTAAICAVIILVICFVLAIEWDISITKYADPNYITCDFDKKVNEVCEKREEYKSKTRSITKKMIKSMTESCLRGAIAGYIMEGYEGAIVGSIIWPMIAAIMTFADQKFLIPDHLEYIHTECRV